MTVSELVHSYVNECISWDETAKRHFDDFDSGDLQQIESILVFEVEEIALQRRGALDA